MVSDLDRVGVAGCSKLFTKSCYMQLGCQIRINTKTINGADLGQELVAPAPKTFEQLATNPITMRFILNYSITFLPVSIETYSLLSCGSGVQIPLGTLIRNAEFFVYQRIQRFLYNIFLKGRACIYQKWNSVSERSIMVLKNKQALYCFRWRACFVLLELY